MTEAAVVARGQPDFFQKQPELLNKLVLLDVPGATSS